MCREGEEESVVEYETCNEQDEQDEEEEWRREDRERRPPLRLPCSIAWARCPDLRPAITSYLTSHSSATDVNSKLDRHRNENSKGLCFTVRTSYAALSCVTRYMISGILLIPAYFSHEELAVCLDVIKIAQTWGMAALLEEVRTNNMRAYK